MLDLHLATALTIKIALLIKSHSLPFNKLTLTAILAFLLPSTKNHQNATRRFSTVIFITTVKIPHLALFLSSSLQSTSLRVVGSLFCISAIKISQFKMSEPRRRSYQKKDSNNSDSTSFCSSKKSQSKVISAQKITSLKLIDHLYESRQSNHQGSVPSSPSQQQWSSMNEVYRQDPFLKAKLQYILGKAAKPAKKVGVLYNQLNAETFEDVDLTTLKREKEKQVEKKGQKNAFCQLMESYRKGRK